MPQSGSSKPPSIPPPSFPTHNSPRVWFLTSGLSPLAVRLIRLLLTHGDYVAAGLPASEIEDDDRSAEFRELINECNGARKDREGWNDRIRGIRCDGRVMSITQTAIAEAVEAFGRIDILLCNTSEAVVGTVEELSTCPATLDLVYHQFEIIFFGHVNFIKATLPLFRAKHNGHIILLTGITGHIGTPGMPMYAASTWALEGFCDSLAYEIAPFNVKMTIVQPNKEINVLTNKIIFSPRLPQYDSHNNPAPSVRDILSRVVSCHGETHIDLGKGCKQNKSAIMSTFPRLPSSTADRLVVETIHALCAIGGHENPPARHIVGQDGVIAVKEKIKIVLEELEDFIEVSCAVDIFKTDVGPMATIPGTGAPGGSGN